MSRKSPRARSGVPMALSRCHRKVDRLSNGRDFWLYRPPGSGTSLSPCRFAISDAGLAYPGWSALAPSRSAMTSSSGSAVPRNVSGGGTSGPPGRWFSSSMTIWLSEPDARWMAPRLRAPFAPPATFGNFLSSQATGAWQIRTHSFSSEFFQAMLAARLLVRRRPTPAK